MNKMQTCTCTCSLCSWLLPKDKQTLNFVLNQLGTHEEQFLPVLDLYLEEQIVFMRIFCFKVMNLSSLNTKLATSAIDTSFQCYMHDRQNLLTSHALTGYVLKMHNSPLYWPNKILVMNYPVNQETKSKITSSHLRTVTVMHWSFRLLINKTVAVSFIV